MNNERRENKARNVERQTKKELVNSREEVHSIENNAKYPKEKSKKSKTSSKEVINGTKYREIIFLESLILAQDKRWRRA